MSRALLQVLLFAGLVLLLIILDRIKEHRRRRLQRPRNAEQGNKEIS